MACCGGNKTCGPPENNTISEEMPVEESVKEFYGKTVRTRDDLKTGACLVTAPMTPSVKAAMKLIHDEVIKRNYGCGMPFPPAVDGCNVLDLGSGTGRDAFVLSKLVGPSGRVFGVDMTQEQLDVANEYIPYHTEKFGLESPNVEFKKGFLEDLGAAGVPDDFFDCVVSNCVINLCKDKKVALAEAFRVLKKGGEIYFSDIYSNTAEIPEEAKKDKEAWGECLSGALWWKDLLRICEELGYSVPALVVSKSFPIQDERLTKVLEGIRFVSATYRIFKPDPALTAEGPASVTYKGTIADFESSFLLAKDMNFPKGQAVDVDGELTALLQASRYAKHFDVAPSSAENPENLMKIKEKKSILLR